MLETALAFSIGLVSGIITGLVPGINILVAMSILYPVLLYFDTANALIIYVTLGATVQYFASVTGTFFGVVGSPTAIPAMIEGHALFKRGDGDKAIMHAAIGGFIASMIALLLTFALIEVMFVFYQLFNSMVQLTIFFFAIIIFILTSDNKWWINTGFLLFGLFLAHIGYHENTMEEFLVFGITDLYSGLPIVSVILGLFVVPNIILNLEINQKKVSYTPISFSGYLKNIKEMLSYKWIIFRSSMLGYLTGFIPGISYIIGVSAAHSWTKQEKKKKKEYQQGDLHSLVASECANNAGSLSVILPLLLVGIPITGSQSLIYSVAMQNGAALTIDFFQSLYPIMIIAYVMVSIICVFISGKYVNWVHVILKINFNYVYMIVIGVLMLVIMAMGSRTHQELYYFLVFLALLPIGIMFRRYDITPAIYGFILSDNIYYTTNTMVAILQ